MSIQRGRWIREQGIDDGRIEPFSADQVYDGFISDGLSTCGYGLSTSDEINIFTKMNSILIECKAFDGLFSVHDQPGLAIVPQSSLAFAHSTEYFCIPRDVQTICVGKRTYARCGITSKSNAIRAGVGGIGSTVNLQCPLSAKVYANEVLGQVP